MDLLRINWETEGTAIKCYVFNIPRQIEVEDSKYRNEQMFSFNGPLEIKIGDSKYCSE